MKKAKKIISILVIALMLVPFTVTHALTGDKTNALLEALRNDEALQAIGAEITYEGGELSINYSTPNSNYQEYSFGYEGTVISYSSGEIEDYYDAEFAMGHYVYAFRLIQAALQLNGYTEEEIMNYFSNENNSPTYDVNGFEIMDDGEAQEYQSEDETTTLTVSPMSIRVDVSLANLNSEEDEPFEKTETTVDNVISFLENDEDFTSEELDGQLIYEAEIYEEDGFIIIEFTSYTYDYYGVSYSLEDDILSYRAEEIADYEEAENVSSSIFFLEYILLKAYELNGYTTQEVQAFFDSDETTFSYERNGISLQNLGEDKDYVSEDGSSTITIAPIEIIADLNRLNLDQEEEYNVLNGEGQSFDLNKNSNLSFTFDIDFDLFTDKGKILVDNVEVPKENYTLSKGSTIVTFKDEYTKKLSTGTHTISAVTSSGKAEATFTITNSKTNNPETKDSILFYVGLLTISMIGFTTTRIFSKKRFN